MHKRKFKQEIPTVQRIEEILLPKEVWDHIFGYLSYEDSLNMLLVNRFFRRVSFDWHPKNTKIYWVSRCFGAVPAGTIPLTFDTILKQPFKSIQSLIVHGTITEQDFHLITQGPIRLCLTNLTLRGAGINLFQLANLGSCNKLTELRQCPAPWWNDVDLSYIAFNCPQLRILEFWGTNIGQVGLQYLTQCKQLRECKIVLMNNRISAKTLAAFVNSLPTLEVFYVTRRTTITGGGPCEFMDSFTDHLAFNKCIKIFYLVPDQISPKGIANLKILLPLAAFPEV